MPSPSKKSKKEEVVEVVEEQEDDFSSPFDEFTDAIAEIDNKIEEEAAEAERKIIKKHEASKVAVYKKRDEAAKTEPEFWKTAFEAFAMFELAPLGVWGEGDQAALESLETVEVTRTGEDLYTISVKMTFKADESRPFKNSELVKTVKLDTDEESEKDGDVQKSTKLELIAKEGDKSGSKRKDADPDVVFFTFFESEEVTPALMLADFYVDAHRYFVGDIPMGSDSDSDDEDEVISLESGEDGEGEGEEEASAGEE